MSRPYPTFDRCPECSGMLWSDPDTDGAWCEECEWGEAQRDLFNDSPDGESESCLNSKPQPPP
jgi:hypothetical protein